MTNFTNTTTTTIDASITNTVVIKEDRSGRYTVAGTSSNGRTFNVSSSGIYMDLPTTVHKTRGVVKNIVSIKLRLLDGTWHVIL